MAELTVKGVGANPTATAKGVGATGKPSVSKPVDVKQKSVPKPLTEEQTRQAIEKSENALKDLQDKAAKCEKELSAIDKAKNPEAYNLKRKELTDLNRKIKGHKGQKAMLENYIKKFGNNPKPPVNPPKVKPAWIKNLKKAGKIGAALALVAGLALLLLKSCDGKKEEPAVPTPVVTPPVEEEEQPVTPIEEEDTQPTMVETVIAQNRDTIESIAKRYGVSVDELKELNADKVKRFRTPSGKIIEGFIVGAELKLPKKAPEVDGMKDKSGANKDYEDDMVKNFDKIPKELWNQFTTREFRQKHHLGEFKDAA